MHVELTTNNYIEHDADLADRVQAEVDHVLGRFGDQITRVEVHLGDVNSDKKSGIDIRCTMEARIAGHQPLIASHDAASIDEAVSGAAERLERVLDSTFGRLGHVKGRTSFGGDQAI
ncbi:HPF/RaiA family ribosome-associated protein [Tautonia sociabilis]|uniref:Ribosomal subunit interface protein n=1 Tax=Tautonia sociabilis TaxID=2080755 RepID=A0A432MHU9_9BACT|nr:HPF/RaiA family ribosome-associated protein [Tautonia sociabilis]RUL86712.1 ribosomal subunit interface protein [Tautonia sociabilis]